MKKLFIHIPKNAGMTIRGSESFLEHIVPVQRKWIANFKDFNQTMKAYGERDVKGVELLVGEILVVILQINTKRLLL